MGRVGTEAAGEAASRKLSGGTGLGRFRTIQERHKDNLVWSAVACDLARGND
jgi:hypothetical protein